MPLIVYGAASKLDLVVSGDTVARALKDMGYSYKRPTKTVPARAPTKDGKAARFQALIEEIKTI